MRADDPTLPADPERAPVPAPDGPTGITWRAMARGDVDGLVELEGAMADEDHPGIRVTREQILTAMGMSDFDPERDAVVAVDGDGRLVAQGRVVVTTDDASVFRARLGGGVRPERRREGLGGRVLDWQIATATRRTEGAGPSGSDSAPVQASLVAAVRGDAPGAAALLRSRGFAPARYFVEMHRGLASDVVREQLPSDLRLVRASRVWWERVREAQNEIFRDHWGTEPISAERWTAMRSLPSARDDLSLLAVEGAGDSARVVGIVLVSVHVERFAPAGFTSAYVDVVGVRREHRGRGVATALLSAALGGIRREGLERAVLDVDAASLTGALRLYEHLGFIAADRLTVHERTVRPTPGSRT